MASISFIFVVLMAVAVLGRLSRRLFGDRSGASWPLESLPVLSAPEQSLYFRLVEALPDHLVFAQVQLSRMLRVKRVAHQRAWRNRIDRKSADFVICRKDSSVLAVVELDDSTHRTAVRQKADAEKDAALASAGIPVVRWNVKGLPDAAAIRDRIGRLLEA